MAKTTTTTTPQQNTTDKNRADYRCKAAIQQCDDGLELCRDLAIGEKAIKAKVKYLPQEDKESDKDYSVRYLNAMLFNTFQKTLNALVGMGFKVNPILGTDVPLKIRTDLEDADLAGTHFDVFMRIAFYRAIRDGHTFIFIDYQPPLMGSVTSASPIPDAADEIAAGRRPYWVNYEKDQAFNWASDRINGETVLTRITFRECVTLPDGEYGERESIRYRKLKLQVISEKAPGKPAVYGVMEWELFEEIKDGNKVTLQRIDGGVTDLTRIPVVTIYTGQTGFLISDPPLLGLARLNMGHYRQWSDLTEQVRWLTPMAIRKLDQLEIDKKDDAKQKPRMTIGRRSVITIIGKESDFKLESHDPDCIKPAMDFITRIEQWMSVEGVSLIAAKDEKEVTLGEKEMDQGERMSSLAMWLRAMSDGGEQALRFHARYYGLDDGGSITLQLTGVTESAVTATPAPLPTPQQGVTDANSAPVA